MAGTLKYYVPRCAKVKFPVETGFETRRAKHVVAGKAVEKNMQSKTHKFREIEINKDGSFDLHLDDVDVLKGMGYRCIPWNEHGTITVKGSEEEAKAASAAEAKKAAKDEKDRQAKAENERRRAEKVARVEEQKRALADAKKKADEKAAAGKGPSGNRPAAPVKPGDK